MCWESIAIVSDDYFPVGLLAVTLDKFLGSRGRPVLEQKRPAMAMCTYDVEQSPSVYRLLILLSFLYDLMHTRI